MEWEALYLMKRKEKDLARATKKTMELEAFLKKAEMENEWWERLAKANEAMDKEELIRVNNNNTAEDAESHCCGSCDQRDDQQGEKKSKKVACKHCRSRSSCVLFLPCRQITYCFFSFTSSSSFTSSLFLLFLFFCYYPGHFRVKNDCYNDK
ncbi:putative BOI-related E3 ubiquitin-protein ligase 2 [Gossypium australe]|uniref:Putative BOI-related E3 ubiquitin-protein ligase 2 n=1 Tax=Gossypium australe TaxID=47621 RepID=A0A5B6WT50_9ROSI|nr:putative BOI-related E3 ubiquitin-protein ligase 2 [Gossypium australe]